MRWNNFSGERVLHVAGGLHKDSFIRPTLRHAGSALAIDTPEERRDAVVVALADLFERMMMAPRATDPHSEKHLSRIVDVTIEVANLGIPLCRRIRTHVACRRDNPPHKTVVRHVGRDRTANPAVKRNRPGNAGRLAAAFVPQNVGPLHRKLIGIARVVEQPLDELHSFCR